MSELCRICHSNQSKYRCPGCLVRTCSLPCYKRHQQRATCIGKVNPAGYMKKSQLATPAGIDRDYNYLKGLETRIERANVEIEDRGIGVLDGNYRNSLAASMKNIARGRNHNSALQKYLIEHRITIDRAPIGMTRQRVNMTRPTKRNNIAWTVEWIDAQGRKFLQNDCIATSSIVQLYDVYLAEQRHVVTGVKKRKRNDAEDACPMISKETKNDRKDRSIGEYIPMIRCNDQPSEPPSTIDPSLPTKEKLSTTATSFDFYLLRPLTSTSAHVLVPITNPTSTSLTNVLEDRTVLEFPTIIAMPIGYELEMLPQRYMLEKDYNADQNSKRRLASTNGHVDTDAIHSTNSVQKSGNGMDTDKILNMLRRDMAQF